MTCNVYRGQVNFSPVRVFSTEVACIIVRHGSDTCPADETTTQRRFPFNVMYIRSVSNVEFCMHRMQFKQ